MDGVADSRAIDNRSHYSAVDAPPPGSAKSSFQENENTIPKMTTQQILKNVVVVSMGFLFLFTAFQSMANLQTSLNREEGVGAWSLSTIYVSLIVSCLFLPNFIIARLGCKWTIPVSMIGYIVFMGANFHAVKGTMIPASVILGLGAAPLWSAKCTYLTQIGVWYAKLTNRSQDAVINSFFGFFFLVFQSSQIWGNLIASLVFEAFKKTDKEEEPVCGADFCQAAPADNGTSNKFEQPSSKVYTVCGIYLGCAIMAALVVSIFLDKIVLDKESREEDRGLNPKLLLSTLKHLFSSKLQMLLVPITIYSGVEQAFLGGDYTKAFISCSLGIWNLGYVMICYGVVDALCSFAFGRLVQYVGHIPFFILAFVTHGSLQLAMLFWTPSSSQPVIFYIIAGLWGMGDAVIQTQINALYGFLFSDNTEAAFANYRLWESLGFAVTYAYNDYLCIRTKLYICMAVLSVGMLGYAAAEGVAWKQNKNSKDLSEVPENREMETTKQPL